MCAGGQIAMSLINPISAVGSKPTRLPESTGVLGFQSAPSVFTASIFSSPGVSIGGTETTGVNSFSSSGSSSSSCGSSINVTT